MTGSVKKTMSKQFSVRDRVESSLKAAKETSLALREPAAVGRLKTINVITDKIEEALDCEPYSTRKEDVNGDYVTVSYEK